VTFAEFRRFDIKARRQRQVLFALQRHDVRLKLDFKNRGVKDAKKPFKGWWLLCLFSISASFAASKTCTFMQNPSSKRTKVVKDLGS
jgi:hypothetical protein